LPKGEVKGFHFDFPIFCCRFDLKRSLRLHEVVLNLKMEISKCDIHEIVLVINLNFKIMWIPISIDDYVKVHLNKNPNEKENVLRVRIEVL